MQQSNLPLHCCHSSRLNYKPPLQTLPLLFLIAVSPLCHKTEPLLTATHTAGAKTTATGNTTLLPLPTGCYLLLCCCSNHCYHSKLLWCHQLIVAYQLWSFPWCHRILHGNSYRNAAAVDPAYARHAAAVVACLLLLPVNCKLENISLFLLIRMVPPLCCISVLVPHACLHHRLIVVWF